MTEGDRYEITVLAEELDRAERAYEAQAMQNTPSAPLEREAAMAALHIADARVWELRGQMERLKAKLRAG